VTAPLEIRVEHLEEDRRPGMRLGRHVRHDSRSRAFAAEQAPLSTLHSARHHRLVPVYDQGDIGSCTANAACGAVSTAPFRHHIRSQTYVQAFYHQETVTQGGPIWRPDDVGSDGLTAAQVAKQQGWITSYLHCFSLESALTQLQDRPVLLGLAWRTGCDIPNSDGIIRVKGTVRGGHEVLLDQIDVDRQLVWLQNSWGDGWGLGGRAAMAWHDLDAALADSGDATIFLP
jgi:hypothetical protein